MVGMLLKGTVDIAISDLTQTEARQSAISFSSPVFFEPEALFLSCVRVKSLGSSFSIANILDLRIWLALAASTFLCSLQLTLILKISTSRSIRSSACGAIWHILEVICCLRSGAGREERRMATGVVQIFFAVLVLVLLKGVLSSDLYAAFRQSPEGPLNDWETFSVRCQAGEKTLVVLSGSAQTAFLEEKIDLRQLQIREIEQIGDFLRVADDHHVLWTTHSAVVRMARTLETRAVRCFTSDLGFHSGKDILSFGLKKGANFEWLDRVILRLHETGILTHVLRTFDPQRRPIEDAHSSKITFDLIAPVAKFFACLGLAEICVLLTEIGIDWSAKHVFSSKA